MKFQLHSLEQDSLDSPSVPMIIGTSIEIASNIFDGITVLKILSFFRGTTETSMIDQKEIISDLETLSKKQYIF